MSIRRNGMILGGQGNVDQELSTSSLSPVQNRVVTLALENKADLVDGKVPQDQLPNIGTAPIIADTPPTTSTEGALGQLAVNPGSAAYICIDADTASTPSSYTWKEIPDGSEYLLKTGGTVTGTINIVKNGIGLDVYASDERGGTRIDKDTIYCGWHPNTWSTSYGGLSLGYSHSKASGAPVNGRGWIMAGECLELWCNSQLVSGKWNTAKDCARITGNGISGARKNIEELSWDGELYVAKSYSTGITTIAPATSEATLNYKGTYFHTPVTASTYVMPAISDTTRTHEILMTVRYTGYYRDSADDTGSAYAWKSRDNAMLYTNTDTPAVNSTDAYSDDALTTLVGKVKVYDSVGNSIMTAAAAAFTDSASHEIVPMPGPTPTADMVVCYRCTYEPLLAGWAILPVELGTYLGA